MKKIFCLLLLSLSQIVTASDTGLFQGEYECSGKELDSDESFKHIVKMEKTGKTYSLSSQYEGESYYGTGIYDSTNQSLAAVFVNPADAKETGIIIFQARNNNELAATWTYLGKKTIAKAVCKKVTFSS